MTWSELLAEMEGLEEALEHRPPETRSAAHFARIELANAVARAKEILEALAHDEEHNR